MVETILVFCAHPDDHILGAGGTIKKYTKAGKKVMFIILSYGESSHPWFHKHITVEMRVNETLKADKLVGTKETIFFGLTEGNFPNDAKKYNIKLKIKNIIKKYKPVKIFTHTSSDPHPDHKATEKLVLESFDSMKYHCDLYTFDVWNPLNIKSSTSPKLVVDISDTFKIKLKALKCFKSQKAALFSLLWSVYYRAILLGLQYNCKFAESFHKIR